jgi:nucleotide-binding universal stress UspA family protein
MTLFVPFDGSELAEAALARATEFGTVFDEDVLAASVIPKGNADYARRRGWLGPEEPFDRGAVASRLHAGVTDICPSADFRHRVVDRFAPAGAIARELRKMAANEDVSMAFVGSDNAGRVVTSLASVGSAVSSDESYDVVIVRRRRPPGSATLRRSEEHRRLRSEFYLPE